MLGLANLRNLRTVDIQILELFAPFHNLALQGNWAIQSLVLDVKDGDIMAETHFQCQKIEIQKSAISFEYDLFDQIALTMKLMLILISTIALDKVPYIPLITAVSWPAYLFAHGSV